MVKEAAVAKINGQWDIGLIRIECIADPHDVLEADTFTDFDAEDAVAMLRTKATKDNFTYGPYVLLSLEDSRRLRAYLEMCEENFEEKHK